MVNTPSFPVISHQNSIEPPEMRLVKYESFHHFVSSHGPGANDITNEAAEVDEDRAPGNQFLGWIRRNKMGGFSGSGHLTILNQPNFIWFNGD